MLKLRTELHSSSCWHQANGNITYSCNSINTIHTTQFIISIMETDAFFVSLQRAMHGDSTLFLKKKQRSSWIFVVYVS